METRPILGTLYSNNGESITPQNQEEHFIAYFSGDLLDAGTAVKLDNEKIFIKSDDKGLIGVLAPYNKGVKNTLTAYINGSVFVKLAPTSTLKANDLAYADNGEATHDNTKGPLLGTCIEIGEDAYEPNDKTKANVKYALIMLNIG